VSFEKRRFLHYSFSRFFYPAFLPRQIAAETGCSLEEVREDASVILEEMSQNLQLGFIRLMGYVFSKVFKRLFTSINVNMEGLNAVRTPHNVHYAMYTTQCTLDLKESPHPHCMSAMLNIRLVRHCGY